MDTASIISLVGIVLALFGLIFMAMKGISIYIYAPFCAVIVMLFSGLPVWETLTTIYMDGFVRYAKSYFLLFMFSSIFAKIMGDSGAADVIAISLMNLSRKSKRNPKLVAMLCIHLVNIVFTMGGINLFVVIFLMISIAKTMYKEMDIPWHLYNAGAWASGTITMTMLPGSPQAQNLIPMDYLGTNAAAAPVLGSICSVLCVIMEMFYVIHVLRKSERENEGFYPTGAIIDAVSSEAAASSGANSMPFWKAILPSVILLFTLNFLDLPSVLIPLLLGSVVAVLLYWERLPALNNTLASGAEQSTGVVASVCVIVGFGSVVAATSGYELVVTGLDALPFSPLLKLFVAINVCSCVAGSSSGGLAIGLNSFAQQYVDMGINPQVIHRISAIASGGLDSMPWNGYINANLKACGLSIKNAYKHSFWENTAIPILIGLIAVVLADLGVC